MTEIIIRKQGRAGRITLNRPDAMNALSHAMSLAIEAALDEWRNDDDVSIIIVDSAGDRAFCAGGDIALMYSTGQNGDAEFGRRFWRDEYRMNAKISEFPKSIVSFLQGFTMGGGVGVGCHGSHRIVCETSKIAMPECTIGLIPDVGGSFILAHAPGRLGEYLGLTGDRMEAGDAIYAGFADFYVPQADWSALIADLCESGDPTAIERSAQMIRPARLLAWQDTIDAVFGGDDMADIVGALDRHAGPSVDLARKAINRNSPLAMAVALTVIRYARTCKDLRGALAMEYRFTHRALHQSDFMEGIRAAIIDKDRAPKWRHAGWGAVPDDDIIAMTLPLGPDELTFERE